MVKCPFLSTQSNKVLCFEECAFYQHEKEKQEVCPFKNLAYNKFYSIQNYDDTLTDVDENDIYFNRHYVENY